jgi:hypothetical protein
MATGQRISLLLLAAVVSVLAAGAGVVETADPPLSPKGLNYEGACVWWRRGLGFASRGGWLGWVADAVCDGAWFRFSQWRR